MGNVRSEGLHITPLTMTVCGVLWAVLFALGAWSLSKQSTANEKLAALVEQRVFDRATLEEIKGAVRTNTDDIRAISTRVTVLEGRK